MKTNATQRSSAPWSGHLWTIAPNVLADVRPRSAPPGDPWSTQLHDSAIGTLDLHGVLRREQGVHAGSCLIVVHGLGGSLERPYCVLAAQAAQRAGISCLRISLRGADRSGQDFYHGGLTADLEATVRSTALANFERIYILGYSMGGHVSLRYATLQNIDPRVRAVAAVCAPLDLALSAEHIDAPRSYLYRRHLLDGLHDIYRAVAARGRAPTPVDLATSAQALRTWDSLTIAPRFGFVDVEDYYNRMSVGPVLPALQVPSLLVQSSCDPIVPPWTYERHLARPLASLTVERLPRGGHVYFPAVRLDPAQPEMPLEDGVLRWLTQR